MDIDFNRLKIYLILNKLRKSQIENLWKKKEIFLLSTILNTQRVPDGFELEDIVNLYRLTNDDGLKKYLLHLPSFKEQSLLEDIPFEYPTRKMHKMLLRILKGDELNYIFEIGMYVEYYAQESILIIKDEETTFKFHVSDEEYDCLLTLLEIKSEANDIHYEFNSCVNSLDELTDFLNQYKRMQLLLSSDDYFEFILKKREGIDRKPKIIHDDVSDSFLEKINLFFKSLLTKK